jgi:hypothetical protein
MRLEAVNGARAMDGPHSDQPPRRRKGARLQSFKSEAENQGLTLHAHCKCPLLLEHGLAKTLGSRRRPADVRA